MNLSRLPKPIHKSTPFGYAAGRARNYDIAMRTTFLDRTLNYKTTWVMNNALTLNGLILHIRKFPNEEDIISMNNGDIIPKNKLNAVPGSIQRTCSRQGFN